MAKVQGTGHNWRDEPITDSQKIKLLMVLRDEEEIEVERGCPLEEYESDAVDWVNDHLEGQQIKSLDDLTKGEIQELFELFV